MTIRKMIIFLLLGAIGLAVSCRKGGGDIGNGGNNPPPTNNCDGISAKFALDVSPVIQTRCATGIGCHGAGSSNGPGALTNFTQIKNASIGIKSAVVSGQMPLGSSLTNTQIAEISCWVDHGALDN